MFWLSKYGAAPEIFISGRNCRAAEWRGTNRSGPDKRPKIHAKNEVHLQV
jgi:hypothetical protein